MAEYIRLDKFFSSQGICSRKEIKDFIKKGLVTVNGLPASKADMKIDAENDVIMCAGEQIEYKKYVYIMLNKPKGVLSATDDKAQATVLDLIPEHLMRDGLFPVGRLDKDTTGLLLITDDGDLAHRVLSPKNHVEKTYIAKLQNDISDDDIKAFEQGVCLKDGYMCMPAKLRMISRNPYPVAEVVICEGKYHQIKRMMSAIGNKVIELKRVKMGALELDKNLKEGECKEILHKDIEGFLFIKK